MAVWEGGGSKKLCFISLMALWYWGKAFDGWLLASHWHCLMYEWITPNRMVLLAAVCADIQYCEKKKNYSLLQLSSYFHTSGLVLMVLVTLYLSKEVLRSGNMVALLWDGKMNEQSGNQNQKNWKLADSLARLSKSQWKWEVSHLWTGQPWYIG